MFNRLKALVWLREWNCVQIKIYWSKYLMPYGLLFIYRSYIDTEMTRGSRFNVPMLSTAGHNHRLGTAYYHCWKGKKLIFLLSGVRHTNNLSRFCTSSRNYYFSIWFFVSLVLQAPDISNLTLKYGSMSHVDPAMAVILINLSAICCYFFDTIKSSKLTFYLLCWLLQWG